MTAQVDIVNRALSALGTRTTVSTTELANNSSNEAIQANLIYAPFRNRLLRMAPWNCAFNTATLTYITSAPGTPENTSAATTVWQKGQPAPPWAYEYQYPVDCLRACWITPQTATGFASGIPITTAVTGGAPSFWQGPPVKFRVAIDQFLSTTTASIISGGAGYAIGDTVTFATQPNAAGQPQGAPPQVIVTNISAGGVITAISIVNVVLGESTPIAGSFFYPYTSGNNFTQGST